MPQVARLGRAAANGMLAGGVLPVLKHIPGHGRATMDSHFDRIQNMMFTRVKRTTDKGELMRDARTGEVLVENDGCR